MLLNYTVKHINTLDFFSTNILSYNYDNFIISIEDKDIQKN